MEHVVILGAGFGGLELATILSDELAGEARVTLIDRNGSFVFGFSKLEVMFGKRRPDEVRMYYRDIAKAGVEFPQETVTSIDPWPASGGRRRDDMTPTSWSSPSAPTSTPATPGLAGGDHEFYSVEGGGLAAARRAGTCGQGD